MGETIMVFICPANFFCESNPFSYSLSRVDTLHPEPKEEINKPEYSLNSWVTLITSGWVRFKLSQ